MASRRVDVPQQYIGAMRKLAVHVAQSDTYPRIDQVVRATTGRFYWRNVFEAYFDSGRMDWQFPNGEGGDTPLHYTIPIYQQYGRSFISQVGVVPRLRFDSRKIQNPSLGPLATKSEAYRKRIETANRARKLCIKAARLMWTDGPIAFYTRQVRDPRFGLDEDGKPGIGPRIDVFGILEAKAPINIREVEDFPHFQINIEIDSASACALLKIDSQTVGKTAPGDNMFDRTSRLAVTQGTRLMAPASDTSEQMPTWQRTWVRPANYIVAEKDDRQWLVENFPEGAYISYIGEKFHEARAEDLNDHIRMAYPLDADGQSTPAAGAIILDVQDLENDMTDLQAEKAFKGIPAIYGDKGLIDFAAIAQQKAQPGAHWPTMREMNPDEKMADRFWAEPPPDRSPDEMMLHQQLRTEIPQGLTGLYPAVLGDTDPASQTKGGLLAIRDASRGQQGPAWQSLREAYKDTIMLSVQSNFEQDNDPQASEFTKYGKDICLEGDESFPTTDIEKREAFQAIIDAAANGNQGANAMIMDPQNAEFVKRMTGEQDLVIQAAVDAAQQMMEIAQLLADGGPVPDPTAQLVPGQPPPMRPTVPIDEFLDNHEVHLQRGKDWASSFEGLQERQDNPEGCLNVKLHLQAHAAVIQKNAQAAQQQAMQSTLTVEAAKHPPKPPEPPKGPSISFKAADLTPGERIQSLAQDGIQGDMVQPTPQPAPVVQ